MTGTRPPLPADSERSLRAAEIALGLAGEDGRDGAPFDDAQLARDVERWRDDFAGLARELKPLSPPPRVWTAISAALVADAAATQSRPRASVRAFMDSLWVWRALTGIGFAAAAVALLLLLRVPNLPQQTPVPGRALLVSPLLPREGAPVYVVTYDAERAVILAVPAATRVSRDATPWLWLVAKGAPDPIAIGILDPERPSALKLEGALARLIDSDADLVVTLEPTGPLVATAARGPVVAHGRFTAL